MQFNVAFGKNNVFGFDAKPVTNASWVQSLIDNDRPVSDLDRMKAQTDPRGTHAYGTLCHVREECGPEAYVTYAV